MSTTYTKAQIAAAREIDLLSYLEQAEPGTVRRSASGEHCLVEHDSFKISNGRWFWHSRGYGGAGALDFLMKVRGVSFPDALGMLVGAGIPTKQYRVPQTTPPTTPPKPLLLPEANARSDEAIAYLRSRGVDQTVIDACIAVGTLYESKSGDCVFVGRDAAGTERFGCIRATDSDRKQDVPGSDKRFGFKIGALGAETPTQVAVFESPIDAMSYATLYPETNGVLLSLAGTSPKALMQFLCDHPTVTKVNLCLDNDSAGLIGIQRCRDAIQADPVRSAQVKEFVTHPAPSGKDWNGYLQQSSTHKSPHDPAKGREETLQIKQNTQIRKEQNIMATANDIQARISYVPEQKSGILAYAEVTLGGNVTIHNVRLMDGKNGLFTAMPSVKTKSGEYKDVCFPSTVEMRRRLTESLVAAYESYLNGERAPESPIPCPTKDMQVQASIGFIPPDVGSVKALANVKMNDNFYMNGLRLMEGDKGMFVSFPGVKTQSGDYKNIISPANNVMRATITDAVVSAYQDKLQQLQQESDRQIPQVSEQTVPQQHKPPEKRPSLNEALANAEKEKSRVQKPPAQQQPKRTKSHSAER